MKGEEVEIDELCGFVAQKSWVWVGVNRRGRQVLDAVGGERRKHEETALWTTEMIYYPDPWRACPAVLPTSRQEVCKRETYTVETVNSIIPHYLARFHRRTACFSRLVEMMGYSLELLFFLRVHGGWLELLSIRS